MRVKQRHLIFWVIILFFRVLIAQESYTGQTIEEILSLPEEEIDLGLACLVLAKDAYPNLNIEFFDYVLDYMANRVKFLMQGFTDPEARIGMLKTYLYRPGWWNDSITFTYDLDDLEARKKENQFLNGYLATKKGSCTTMPMLHLVLADRLGWPIYAVRSPQHFFCRYVADGFEKNNIEATCGGGYISNERYILDFGIPDKAIQNGVYLRTLSKKEYLASLLSINALHFISREKNLKRAIRYLQLALSIDSTLASAHWNLSISYYQYAKQLNQEMQKKIQSTMTIYEIERQVLLKRRKDTIIKNRTLERLQIMVSPPKPSLWPSGQGLPALLNLPEIKPQQQIKPPTNFSPYMAELQSELQFKLRGIKLQYHSRIEQALTLAKLHKKRAVELGIVVKLPEEFFRRQARSIEEFKKTGKY